MAIKIYLAPSNQEKNKYIIGNKTERDVCNAITDKLVALLKNYDVSVKRGLSGSIWRCILPSSVATRIRMAWQSLPSTLPMILCMLQMLYCDQ